MDDFLPENPEIDQNSQSEYSESEICSSSSSDSEFVPWLEHVKNDGSLFYVENVRNLVHHLDVDDPLPESHDQESKSNFNPAQKIRKWMKKRKKKVWKSFPLKESSKSETNFYPFQNSFTQSKDVFVDLNAIEVFTLWSENKFSVGEILFGLKLGSSEENYLASDKPCILEIWQNKETRDVKIGDILLSVNDINVNMGNLEDVLKSILFPSKVKLTIASPSPKSQVSSQLPTRHYDLGNELLGEPSIIQHVKSRYQHMPHCVLYLTIANGTNENKDDVIYRYPDDDTLLFQLKGMFLTLGHMISDVASPPLLSCSVMVLSDLVHVGFVTEDDKIMVLAFPASVASVTEIQHFSTGLAKFLKYLFSSLQKAFTIGKDDGFLDNFFTLYFEHYLSLVNYSLNSIPEPHLTDILHSAHWFPLPNNIKVEIDDILSELESGDFGVQWDGFCKNRRLYNIVGSCLFYKGYLLCSHLPKNDLLDIHLYLHHNHLLELTRIQSDAHIIIWKEVFPSRYQECLINPDPDFQEYHGRWFMLIVVMYHSILAVLLDDSECCIKHEDNAPPEPFYVKEVQNALWIFHDYGIGSAVEKLLHFSVFPAASHNLLFKDNSENSLASTFSSNADISSSGHNVSDHSTSHSSLTEKNQDHIDGESDTESSYSNDSNKLFSLLTRSRSRSVSAGYLSKSEAKSDQAEYYSEEDKRGQNFSSLPNLHEAGFNSNGICFENSFRMVSNFGNNLFHYLHMDPVEGVFIAPITPNSSLPESLQKSILNNFYRCCLRMRTIFGRSLRNEEITKANIITKYGVNSFLQSAYEQGLLFKCDQIDVTKQKSSQAPTHFWVIGRLFFAPEHREVYVCHLDGAPQDVVEMAFRLGFGLSF